MLAGAWKESETTRVEAFTPDEADAVSFATTAYDAERPPVPAGASTNDPLIGRRIDHFEIRALLGQGGMGTVYLAHDLSLDRPVAIKVLRRELGDKPDLVNRLVHEAQAQARLCHPHVVNVYYIGVFAGAPYFAMEYVHGETLADRLSERGPLPWEEALEYVIQTARALLDAHERGIVHRDVKPSNLLVRPGGPGSTRSRPLGHIKVADFGLAAQSGRRQEHLVGSPTYASPEQLRGKAPDHRSDIYSLGITFHELLTATAPFEAESFGELVHLHQTAPRPGIAEHRAPWRLRRLITEMMDPDPARRPWTYEELLERLEALRAREIVPGGVTARAIALGVDAALALALGAVLSGAGLGAGPATLLALLAWGAHYVLGHRLHGETLGKRLFHLRIQGSTRAVNAPALALRFVATLWGPLVIAAIAFGRGAPWPGETLAELRTAVAVGLDEVLLGFAPEILIALSWAAGLACGAFDDRRRALHDWLGRTRVIYAMRADRRS